MAISIDQAVLDLAVAPGLSAVIGFERQWRNRLAGLRTNTLVALGAASFVIFAQLIPDGSSPTRVAALETGYLVSVTCRGPDEAHVRALLLQGFAACGLTLRRIDSNDVEGLTRVVVTAFTMTSQRVDGEVTKIVGRLSLEPTVSAATWQAEARTEPEISPPSRFSGSTLLPGGEDGTATS